MVIILQLWRPHFIRSRLKGWENVLFERGSESGLKWKYWTRRRLAVVILCSNRCLKIEVTARQKSAFPVSAFHRGFQVYSHVSPEDCEVQTSRAKRQQIRTKAAKACRTIQNRWASILTSLSHRRLEYQPRTALGTRLPTLPNWRLGSLSWRSVRSNTALMIWHQTLAKWPFSRSRTDSQTLAKRPKTLLKISFGFSRWRRCGEHEVFAFSSYQEWRWFARLRISRSELCVLQRKSPTWQLLSLSPFARSQTQ